MCLVGKWVAGDAIVNIHSQQIWDHEYRSFENANAAGQGARLEEGEDFTEPPPPVILPLAEDVWENSLH
eukprot:8966590-Prorocentrum_lima.AAC.1